MELIQTLNPKCCTTDLHGKTKDQVLLALSELVCKNPALEGIDPQEVFIQLKTRESQGSTGFGKGIAIPHARLDSVKDFVVAVGVSRRGLPFDALDKRKCRLFFVILGPSDGAADHLKVLAAISRLASQPDVKKELLKSPSGIGLYETLARRVADLNTSFHTRKAMKLMFLVLYYEDLLYDILEYFLAQGIDGATITEGYGMGQYISNVPLFAEFIGFMQPRKNQSKTIMAIFPAEQENQLIAGIEEITGNLNTSQGAMIMTTDLSFYKGTMKVM